MNVGDTTKDLHLTADVEAFLPLWMTNSAETVAGPDEPAAAPLARPRIEVRPWSPPVAPRDTRPAEGYQAAEKSGMTGARENRGWLEKIEAAIMPGSRSGRPE